VTTNQTDNAANAAAARPGIVAGAAAQLAHRYAIALYALAEEQKCLDAVGENFQQLQQLLRVSTELDSVINNPRLSRVQQVKAMQALGATAQFHKLTQNLLGLIAQNRRTALLPNIANAYLLEAAKRRGETLAEVTSAQKLSPQQAEALTTVLQKSTGGKLQIMFHEDRDLIGGFTVKMGSRFVDASLKTKLARLARHMKEAA
jgi:F-type H+-transporting ATPase subunit delta